MAGAAQRAPSGSAALSCITACALPCCRWLHRAQVPTQPLTTASPWAALREHLECLGAGSCWAQLCPLQPQPRPQTSPQHFQLSPLLCAACPGATSSPCTRVSAPPATIAAGPVAMAPPGCWMEEAEARIRPQSPLWDDPASPRWPLAAVPGQPHARCQQHEAAGWAGPGSSGTALPSLPCQPPGGSRTALLDLCEQRATSEPH